jgi:hypothetical protein
VTTRHRFANTIVVDSQAGEIRIDGDVFPYWTTPEPEIELIGEGVPAVLNIGIYADNLTYISSEGEARVLATAARSAESEWARRRAQEIVYEGLSDVIQWLARCELDRQKARAASKAPYPTEGLDF